MLTAERWHCIAIDVLVLFFTFVIRISWVHSA
jgi:hypothetical protein